ncbi:MAG: hypothetical protein JOY65_07675, partial [Acetobacteraceae bacterium]|nr:hypothetical protein [Acetobacteraceae bacterium]
MRLTALLLAAAAGAATGAGASEPGVRVHGTQHRGVGRLVFDVAPGLRWREAAQGDAIVLRFDAPTPLRPPATLPRNVLALDEDADGAVTVRLVPGARAHTKRTHHRLVIEARDPPPQFVATTPPPDPLPQGEGEKKTPLPLREGLGEGAPAPQPAPPPPAPPAQAPPPTPAAPPPPTTTPAAQAPPPPPAAPAPSALAVAVQPTPRASPAQGTSSVLL